jgi:hypothetical protein
VISKRSVLNFHDYDVWEILRKTTIIWQCEVEAWPKHLSCAILIQLTTKTGLILPACHSALQPWVSLGLFYNQSPNGINKERENAYISVRTGWGGSLKIHTGRWENNIKMGLQEIEPRPTVDLFGSE